MFRDKLNKFLIKQKGEGNDKRKIENLVFFVVILIITIVIINIIWNGNKTTTKTENTIHSKQLALTTNQDNISDKISTEDNLEERLEQILWYKKNTRNGFTKRYYL